MYQEPAMLGYITSFQVLRKKLVLDILNSTEFINIFPKLIYELC